MISKIKGKLVKNPTINESLQGGYARLWRYCLALTGNLDQANDLAQAASVRVLEKSHQFEAGTQFDRWVFRIAQRIWFNELRSESIRRGGGLSSIDSEDLFDAQQSPDIQLSHRQMIMAVIALPEAQRITVYLVYIEGYSYREASESLGIPVGTVMSRLSVARSKLSQALS